MNDQRAKGMIARAIVSSIEDGQIQAAALSVMADDDLEDVERVQNYGLNSWPDDEAQGLVVFVGGNREHGIVVSADFPLQRFPVEKGEVALYSKFNNSVHLKKDGSIAIKAKKLSVKNDSDDLVSLLVDLVTALNNVTVNTAVGAQPFVNIAEFAALKTKLMAFKE